MKTKTIILAGAAVGILATALVANQYPNPKHGRDVALRDSRSDVRGQYADMRAVRPGPDFNRITKENEWHAAFAPLEVYGSQVTQKHGRIFKTDRDVSEEETKRIINELTTE